MTRTLTTRDRLRALVEAIEAAITANPNDTLAARASVLHLANYPTSEIVLARGSVTITLHGITGTAAALSEAKLIWHWRARQMLGGWPMPDPALRAVQLEWATQTLRWPAEPHSSPETLAQSIAIILTLTDNPILRDRATALRDATKGVA